MLDKDLQRIQISQVLKSQLPFYAEEDSLFYQFLDQYYISNSQVIELSENIDRIINVENFDATKFEEHSTTLTSDITYYDDIIEVSSTSSWPSSYGLLKIDDEIITYKRKDETHFYECVRGFSAIESYQTPTNPGELVFSSSEADSHTAGKEVKNLSNLIYAQIWKKIKTQYLPGFENKNISDKVDKKIFLKHAKDFYETKGTLESFDILFKVLYGDPNVKLVNPSDYVIKPSAAQWSKTNNLIVSVISGDISKTNGQPLYQNNPAAYGNIYLSTLISFDEEVYYEIQLSDDTKIGKFKACPVTKTTTGATTQDTTIFVDSTIGFPNSGQLYINGSYISYDGKNDNQFFNCTIPYSIDKFTSIYLNDFAYSYEDGDINKPVYFRITSVISDFSELLDTSKYLKVGDEIGLKDLGEDTSTDIESYNNRINGWLHNHTYEIKLVEKPLGITKTSSPATINTKIEHGFNLDDIITLYDVDDYDNSFNPPVTGKIVQIYSPTSFALEYTSGILESNLDYKLYRNILISSAGQEKYIADIQNTYVDKFGTYVYVTTSSLPSYSVSSNPGEVYFTVNGETQIITTRNSSGAVANHNFETGDKVYFRYTGSNVGINTGAYFVKKESSTQLKLAYNRAKIFNGDFLTLSSSTPSSNNILILDELSNKFIQDQKLVKRVSINPKLKEGNYNLSKSPLPTPVGILLNGTEVIFSKSQDRVYYGKLTSIDLINGGEDYDIIDPPNVVVEDSVGYGASAFVHIEGGLSRVDLLSSGYDYLISPSIKITGGNGSGATAQPIMKSIYSSIDFYGASPGINTATDTIGFSTFHNFKTGEEVIYRSYSNLAIGIGTIGTPAAGESDTKNYLIDLSKYYVIKVDDQAIKLTNSKSDALAGINTINLTQKGNGNQTFLSTKVRNVVDRIEVINPGTGYVNKKVVVTSSSYPPKESQNIPISLVGINTQENFIYAKNHNFSDKELILYKSSGSSIGLTTTQNYYVIKLDNDKFRLASAGIGTTLSSNNYDQNKYVKFTGFGTGEHTFYTPPISLEILGTSNSSDVSGNVAEIGDTYESSQAIAVPVFTGSVTNVFLKDGGTSYGTPDIINYNRKPNIVLNSGKNALLKPIIINGGISEVYILNGGSGYTSIPDIKIVGEGSFASLRATVTNGKITNVEVLESGKNYKKNTTELFVISRGKNASFTSNIQTWHINLFKRYESIINDTSNVSDSFYIESFDKNSNSIQLTTPIVPKKLRYILDDNLDANLNVVPNIKHSPIVGWAYDGNPIYGPYGSSTTSSITNVKELESGYELIPLPERPSYPAGFFVEDYVYTANGDLDENNGRYCITPEFPNGTYAYFATNQNYPYVLNDYTYEIDVFNINYTETQTNNSVEKNQLIRNTTPYKLNREYATYGGIDLNYSKDSKVLVRSVHKSGVDNIDLIKRGSSYKVNDRINFDNSGTNGRGLDAKVSSLVGVAISSVVNLQTTYPDIEFIEDEQDIVGIFTQPHNLPNNKIVKIVGINTTSYKFIEGSYQIGVTTFYSKLRVAIGNTTLTGINTEISLTESIFSRKIVPDDIIGIGSERFLVLGANRLNTAYKVVRCHDSTVGTSHTEGSEVTVFSRYFTIPSATGIKTASTTNYNRSIYFNPQKDVGYGSTTTSIQVGTGYTARPIGVQTGQGSYTTIEFYSHPFEIGDRIETDFIDNLSISDSFVAQKDFATITVNYDSTSSTNVGIATTSIVRQIKKVNIPPGSIYIPNHQFTTGQKLKYSAVNGIGLTCSQSISLTPTFNLQTGDNVYVIVDTNDFIGISSTLAGISSAQGRLYFASSDLSTGFSHKFKTTYPNPTGQVLLNEGVVTTFDDHNLKYNDLINLNVLPNQTKSVPVKFDNVSARLLINPVGFGSTQVSIQDNVVTINNHSYKTGDKIVYNSSNPAAPLIDGEEYFIINTGANTIKFAEYLYDANDLYYSGIDITSAGIGTHTISLINPPLNFNLGETISFDVSDVSLKSLIIDFYQDNNFTNKVNVKNVTRIGVPGNPGAQVNVLLNTNIPDVFYYKLNPVGISTITSNAYAYNVDKDVDAFSRIKVGVSKYNGTFRVTSVGSTTINFDLLSVPELSQYTNSGVTTFSYTTRSLSAKGSINEISIGFTGTGYLALPEVKNITTAEGTNANLKLNSFDIGRIKNLNIITSGYNLPTDPSLKPKADVPFTLKIKNNYQLKDIVVLNGGKNYLTEPKVICLEHPDIVFNTKTESNSVKSVEININKTGLSEIAPTIIPVNNSNGLSISNAISDGTTNTLTISSDNGEFLEFPFGIGDKIFVEGIELSEPLSGAGGYNSENYNYSYFEVTSVDDTPGAETVSYSIVGLGSTGGYYDATNSVGRVIKADDLAKFTANLEKTDFIENEVLYSNGYKFKVYKDGWNKEKNVLKIVGNSFNISIGDTVVGSKTNSKALIDDIVYTNTFFGISGEFVKENGWLTNTGFTNDSQEKIQDSNYYQNFSYAINSQTSKTVWENDIQELAHPAGMQLFGDVVVDSRATIGIGRSSNLKISPIDSSNTLINILSESSFNTKQYFDKVFEITTDKGISKDVGFLTKKLFDYSICKTNKVLTIDDISNEFTGTSVLQVNGRFADGSNLLALNKEFIQKEVVGFITNSYPGITTNLDFDAEVCQRDVGYIVDSIAYDLKYGGNEKSVASGLAYWTGVGGTSFVDGESQETIAGFRYIIDLSRYIINNVAISTSYQTTPFEITQSFNYSILLDENCSPAYNENCCSDVLSAIGSYVGIITSIIGIGTTAAPNVTIADVSKGGTIVGLTSFKLNNNNSRLLSKSFTAQIACSVGSSVVSIANHGFSTGEELIYNPGAGGTRIAVESTNRVIGGATTDFMPERVFVYKVDINRFKLVGLKTDATATGNYFRFRDLGGGLGVGAGTTHTLYTPYDYANSRAIITIDNIIQSPLYKVNVNTSLSTSISIGSTIVTLTGITSITPTNILRIDDELLEINAVGFGSTNVLSVNRGYMGTVAVAHTVGAGVTVLKGDYNINNGYIYFKTAPYGDVGPAGISTRSTFAGRIFYRLNYDTNYIFDDISDQFNGSKTNFELTSYGQPVTGIITDLGGNVLGPNYGAININNILQKPIVDYNMSEQSPIAIGGSLAFTGSSRLDLPKGGIINRVNIGFGSGYQPLVPAFAIPVVSGGGTIESLTLTSSGFGYRSNVEVKIDSQVGSGASIIALVGTGSSVGIITGFNIISGGTGYASTMPPIINVGIPTAYSNIALVGGTGNGAKVNIIVGSGGSITQFEFANRGIGYEINDQLTISGIPTQVGIATSAFTLSIIDTINDEFSGWHFGGLVLLDDISSQFNGRTKAFGLTKTDLIKERYNINAAPGSGINVSNNLIIILNGILQHPNRNYNLVGGDKLVFTEAPIAGSECLIFFFKGSYLDVIDVDVSPEVKVGDSLRLLQQTPYVNQLPRVITNINTISEVKTTNYIDVGISTDPTFYRTVSLDKQKSDLIVDNVYISKARSILEGKFIPSTRLIKEIKTSDTEIYVEGAYPNFSQLDDLLENNNSIIVFNEKDTKTAKITAVVSAAGTVTDFNVVDGGFGYSSAPEITISTTVDLIPQYGKEWENGNILASVDSFRDFDYGNNLYVACSEIGGISTSDNFKNWNTQSSLTGGATLNSISHGSNNWVVVGAASSIFTSLDGLSWTPNNIFLSRVYVGGIIPFDYPPASFSGNINGVDYGLNKFIAVGAGGTALVSEAATGITTSWVVRKANSNELNSITFGVDNFVAVGVGGAISRSSDGYVWTTHTSGTVNDLLSVRYLNGDHYAVGNNGTILKSIDGGAVWNNVSEPEFASYTLYDITYKNNVYLITGSSQLTLVSRNGEDWIRTTNSNMDVRKLGTELFNIIGVGQSSKYAITESQVVKASVTANISVGGTVTSVTVTDPGFGYDPNVPAIVLTSPAITTYEQFDNIKVIGDYGTIVGIATSAVGISTTTPMVIFEFDSDEVLNDANFNNVERSGIGTGDYFVITNSIVGNGVTTLNSSEGFAVLSIGSSYIDNVYKADYIQSSSSGIVTVFSNVQSIAGIGSTSGFTCARYSWGKIYDFNSRQAPLAFSLNNNGLVGVSTAPLVFRKIPLTVNY
ncbi:baseplate wedge initiator [Synechococcus phage DSL-LC03]|nr:baseplate wedge initiator [Synechococcus phage DSL-LC03]